MAPQGAKQAAPLPKISFRKVEDGDTTQPTGVHDGSARNYGYNGFKAFERPDHYIRHIEPLETELATQVEYDMDEQDQEWLEAMNKDRKKEQMDQVTYEMFEVIMDRLEKEWFDLMKLIPKPEMALPSEDTSCAICDDGEAENSNAILFCDGCNLAVHQDCYGVPYIPEGQWLCRKCTVSPENPVSCILCPNEGGAFKQTNRGQWAHLLCSIWIPEVTVANTHIMEPIEAVESIPKSRWKLICSLCKERVGACIQCDVKTCFTAFHVTCARRFKLLMAMKNLPGQEEPPLRAFCERHLPKQIKELRDVDSPPPSVAGGSVQRHDDDDGTEQLSPQSPTHDISAATKAARAYSQKFSAIGGPPLVPQIIVEHILQYINKIRILKKPVFVTAVARYWSLKRESRRGAPLLKRLHLEPWTASAMNKQQSDEEKAKKLEYLIRLRKDLEKVRMLTELARKREKEKLRSAQTIQAFIEDFLFPFQGILRDAFNEIIAQDRNSVFRHPVTESEAPDYYQIVKKPMTWVKIYEKLESHEYLDVFQFEADVKLVLDNAMQYNPPPSLLYRTAAKLHVSVAPVIERLKVAVSRLAISAVIGDTKAEIEVDPDPDATDDEITPCLDPISVDRPVLGDLEPTLAALELLASQPSIGDDLDFILPPECDPIVSLLAFEFRQLKPLPPPSPSPPPPTTPIPIEGDGPTMKSEDIRHSEAAEDTQVQVPEPQPEPITKSKAKRGRKPKTRPSEPAAPPDPIPTPAEEAKEDVTAEMDPPVDEETIQDAVPEPKEEPGSAVEAKAETPEVEIQSERAPSEPTPPSKPARKSKKRKKSVEDVEMSADESALASSPSPRDQEEGPSRKRKRVDSNEAMLTPPLVDDVGNRDSFLLFNQGWVLPSGTRRGGREKPTLPPAPTSRKSLAHKPSKLSVAATSPADNETLRAQEADQAVSDTTSRLATSHPPELLETAAQVESPLHFHPSEMEAQSRATAEVEEAEVEVQVQQAEMDVEEPQPEDAPRADSVMSDLSSLSDKDRGHNDRPSIKDHIEVPPAAVEVEAIVEADPVVEVEVQVKVQAEVQGAEVQDDGAPRPDMDEKSEVKPSAPVFEGGTLVWAKSFTFPFFPAVVFEEDEDDIPVNVHASKAQCEEALAPEERPLTLVRFYDNTSSWGWIARSRIKMLGDDPDIDHWMLNVQKFKSPSIKSSCRKAYNQALAEMEGPEDLEPTPS